jgi:hypothetical protein
LSWRTKSPGPPIRPRIPHQPACGAGNISVYRHDEHAIDVEVCARGKPVVAVFVECRSHGVRCRYGVCGFANAWMGLLVGEVDVSRIACADLNVGFLGVIHVHEES